MSAIRFAIAGFLALLTALLPGISHAGKSIIILPLADYSSMDSLTAGREQSQATADALSASMASKKVTVIPPVKAFGSLLVHGAIAPISYNKDLRPTANTVQLENEISDALSNRMQNELKAMINAEQVRMTPGLADPDNHLPKPATNALDSTLLTTIGNELGGDYILRGRMIVKSISDAQSMQRQLPTAPVRRNILPMYATVEHEERYAVAAAESYDPLDDHMLSGLLGPQNDQSQVVRMQLWAHDAVTGKTVWSSSTEVTFGVLWGTSGASKSAINTAAQTLINDFWAKVAIDTDGDGIFDPSDLCPDTPRGLAVDAQGCPVDSDKDGVADYLDKCTATPAGVEVDAEGCPKDSDNDGIADHLERCPDTPAGIEVDEFGCPKDSDGDSVPDYLDKCADTPAGREVDNEGCPKPLLETVTMDLRVEFDFDKSIIKPIYRDHLQTVADFLIAYPETTAEIEGHTDKEGTAAYNLKLSQRRAEAVRHYLIDTFKIAPERLTARGYGESLPLDGTGTKKINPKNRRSVAVFTTTVEK
ncbi:MAG: OmpA family protein [Desulfobulbaceae bacterium]|nr:OmpA family protein [Desulfobulbaceae bacterium]